MSERRHNFLWLDLETTGLDPHKCHILEWAAVLAEDDREGDMSPVEQFSGVIGFDADRVILNDNADVVDVPGVDPFVVKMHIENGLWEECVFSEDNTLEEADEFLAGLCERLGGKTNPGSIVLAGSTVHFDLGFVRVHMPRFAAYLSHRCFDVSTLKMAERDWAGEKFKKAEAHRALPDVLESLEHAAEIRAKIDRWAAK